MMHKLLSGLIFLSLIASALADAQTYRVKSGAYELTVSPRYQQTVRSITYAGAELATPTGFYGTVMAPAPGKYIGAGHTEGGSETLLSFSLSVDGKAVQPEIGKVYSGDELVLEKFSKLDRSCFLNRITVRPDGIVEQKRFVSPEGQDFSLLYVNLFCFSKEATDYFALDAAGNKCAGKFEETWNLQRDVRYAAIYDAAKETGITIYYPEIIKGAVRRAAFWNVPNAYKKYYLMAAVPAHCPPGFASPVYTVILRGFKAAPAAAEGAAEAAAGEAAALKFAALPEVKAPAPAAAPAAAPEAGKTAVTFDTDFTRSRDDFAPTSAAGSKAYTTLFGSRPEIDFDTMAHSIRGVKIGRELASIRYPSEGNLPVGSGSFEITFAGDWEGADKDMHILAGSFGALPAGGTPGKFMLYKYKESGIAAYLEIGGGNKLFLSQRVPEWQPGSWHHLVLTFGDGRAALYVDGKKVRDGLLASPTAWPPFFTIGSSMEKSGRGNTATVGNFSAYPVAFSDTEVAALAARRLPELRAKLDLAAAPAAANETVLPASPWFKDRPRLGMEALDDNALPGNWPPLQVDHGKIGVWQREFDFTGPALLRSVKAAGGELLAAPVELVWNGKPVRFTEPVLERSGKGRAVLEKKADNAPVSVRITVEYDGMAWFETEVGESGKMESFQLDYRLAGTDSEFIHYVGAPDSYESQNLVKNSFSRALGEKPGVAFLSPFRTNLWLGNNRRGLLYFVESDQYYYPVDNPELISVERRSDGSAAVRIAMVKTALPAGAPEKIGYRFGFQPTPVKPMPKNWRSFTYTAQYESLKGPARGNHLIYWPDQWRAIMLDPEPTRAREIERNRKLYQKDKAEGKLVLPYWTRLHYPTRQGDIVNPDGAVLDAEWHTEPRRPGGGTHQYDRAAMTSGWQDYLVWCTAQWSKTFGQIDGVYIDETQPIPNRNPVSGGGYNGFDNRRRPTYEIFGSRNMIKRIDYLVEQATGRPASSIAHTSATHAMPSVGLYQAMLIGEQYYSGYFAKRNPEFLPPEGEERYYYSYALPVDRLRAECYYRQWGAVMVFLPCLKNQKELMTDPVPTRDMLSRVMQADMIVWPIFCDADEVRKTWKFRDEFGIGDEQVEFIPFWEPEQAVKSDRKDVVCGTYRKGDRALVIVSNFNREPVTVTVDLARLSPTSAANAETGAKLPLADGKVKLEIPRNDYVALRINY